MAGAHTIARIYGLVVGVNTITTLHFAQDFGDAAQKQALAIAIRDRFMPEFKTGCSSLMNWTAIEIANISNPNDSPWALPVNIVGATANILPQQVAIMWKLSTGQAGRRGRGRLFVPGIAPATNNNGQVASTVGLSLSAAQTTLNGRWGVGGSEVTPICVYSRIDDVLRPVIQFGYNLTLSTIRSRRLGTGI